MVWWNHQAHTYIRPKWARLDPQVFDAFWSGDAGGDYAVSSDVFLSWELIN